MKRFSTMLVAAMAVILGITAWGAARTAQNKAAPKGVGDLTLVSADPADGTTVTGLKDITLNFSEDINLNNLDLYIGKVVDASGTRVARVCQSAWTDDYKLAIITVVPEITVDGQYTVTIDAEAYCGYTMVNDKSPEITLHYAIGQEVITPEGPAKVVAQQPKADEEVVELKTIELTFNKEVSLATGDHAWTLRKGSDAVAVGTASLDSDNSKIVNVELDKSVIEAGDYELVAPEGCVIDPADPDAVVTIDNTYYKVKDSSAVVINGELKLESTLPEQGDISGTEFYNSPNIVVNLSGVNGDPITAAGNSLPILKDGAAFDNVTINANMLAMGAIFLNIEGFVDRMESGVYTIDIPAGFFTCGESNNDAIQLRWSFTKTGGGTVEDPDYELVVNKVQITPVGGEAINLMDPNSKIDGLREGYVMTISTTDNETVKYLWCEVSHMEKNESGVEERIIDKTIQFVGYDKGNTTLIPINRNDANEFEVSLSGDTDLFEGMTYDLTITASNMDGIHAPGYHCFGEKTFSFQGAAVPFEYSDVNVTVNPEPGSEIMDEDFEFVMTFSAPVEIVDELTFQNEGMGRTSSYASISANPNKTVYIFKPTRAFLMGGCYFSVGAVDMQGRPVAGLGASKIKEKTCMQLEYVNNLDKMEFPITPNGGVVESIYSFTVRTPFGGTLGMTTNALDRPWLENEAGDVISYVDINDRTEYYSDGTVVPDTDPEPQVATIAFHLEQEVTAPGVYYFVVPSGSFTSGSMEETSGNRPMRYKFIIVGTPELVGQTVSQGAVLSELGMAGFIFNNAIGFADEDEHSMVLIKDGENYLTSPAFIVADDGKFMACANFRENEAPVKLQEGSEYELIIADGTLVAPGAEISIGKVSVRFNGPAPAQQAPEFVSLTQEIAGHTASIGKVVKGDAATVLFKPADGWKIDIVSFNGSDVTDQMVENAYTTPVLDADAVVKATYVYDGNVFTPSSADEVVGDFKLRAWSENGEIMLAGLHQGMTVDVYTAGGAHVGKYNTTGGDTLRISAATGTYVIVVAENGRKEAIKIQNI